MTAETFEKVLDFDDIEPGDRVRHTTCGPGTVTSKTKTVNVTYDQLGTRGRHWSGRYDRDWFRIATVHLTKIE